MEKKIQEALEEYLKEIKLPKYEEIPDVGLYLDQVSTYINDFTENILDTPITNSMISNYVKKGIIPNPVKKLYYRDQIAFLIYIQLAKSVMSLENLITMQQLHKDFTMSISYNYFVEQLIATIHYVFGENEGLEDFVIDTYLRKSLLKSSIIAIANQIYISKCFKIVSENPELFEKDRFI